MSFKRSLLAVAGFLCLALSSNSALACSADFYVTFIDADDAVQIRVRSTLVHSTGVSDNYGRVDLPDSALGGTNTLYMFDLLNQAYINNTKVNITTNDSDCEISFPGENMGIIEDVSAADFS